MTYLILVLISVCVSFVLGAAWSGLCTKNKEFDEQFTDKLKEFYTKATP